MRRTPYMGDILRLEANPAQPKNVDLGQYFTALQQSRDMRGFSMPDMDFHEVCF